MAASLLLSFALAAAAPPTGFQPEVTVENPTRLDWEFAVADFGPGAGKLAADYDSRKQRYQLYVPKTYDRARRWPLVIFISPGDDPLGWRHWQKPCEDAEALFCAAYAAGNNCPPAQRARIVLDMLDDVRRHYSVNPDETYLTGFSGGGRMACTLAFALPEYFGGVFPICGTNPLNKLGYLRHRARDRLSVALLTGANDFNRGENEDYVLPLVTDLGIRSKLWVVPKLGHGIPGPNVLGEALDWAAGDLKRRQADAQKYPGLAAAPEEVPTPERSAARFVETAEAELRQPDRTWRGVALLQGVVARWGKTDAADRARKLLEEIDGDARRSALLAEQAGGEERQILLAQARGFERLGDLTHALQAYRLLVKHHPNTPDGRKAEEEARRLANLPYLGVGFAASDAAKVTQLVAKGPADRAGLKAGDVVTALADKKVGTAQEFREALREYKPGDKVALEVQRGGQAVTLTVELGALPAAED